MGNFCAGALTTGAFTAMMKLSQSAPASIQSTHYSLLATMEVKNTVFFFMWIRFLQNCYVTLNFLMKRQKTETVGILLLFLIDLFI